MSTASQLKNAPIRQDSDFNWYHQSALILISPGLIWGRTLFFLFYYNRVVAAILSYVIRSWTWHKYRVYVDVKSFQISIIAGRIFFKGFRYHGNNQTLIIQSGYITWRYWLRNFRQLEISDDSIPSLRRVSLDIEKDNNHNECKEENLSEVQGPDIVKRLPCRLIISLKGAEWFIYNNSLAYDNIVSNLADDNPEILNKVSNLEQGSRVDSFHNVKQRKKKDDCSRESRSFGFKKPENSATGTPLNPSNINTRYNESSYPKSKAEDTLNHGQETKSSAAILRLLPIQVECEKVAVVIGNHNTRSVLITKADKADGRIEASNSQSKSDLYRNLLNVQFEHPTVQIKPNCDYKEDQGVTGSRVGDEDSDPLDDYQQNQQKYNLIQGKFRKVWHMIKQILPAFRTSIDPLSASFERHGESEPTTHVHDWQGLSRYIDEDRQDDHQKWASIEYATVSTILESHSAKVEFYYDAVGFVRDHRVNPDNNDYIDNINGEAPPEWGINISFGAATINYGPWADRQRVNIQKVFFPGLFKDAVPTQRLAPGQLRVPTDFRLKIVFDQESVLRVPLKEESKNWKWTQQTENICVQPRTQKRNAKYNRKTEPDKNNHGVKARTFGWLDLKLGVSTVVRYCVDLVPGPMGYSSYLDINLPTAEITTSVNHGLLWKSTMGRIFCDLSNPLKWNGSRAWKFDISSKGLELFILREHIFLLTDLISDWTNGPPPEYIKFCPFKYFVNLHLEDFKIYFNVNDSNIINDPSDFDDNTFIILLGTILDANISIPLDHYRPHHNEISFDVNIKHGRLDLHVPPWNTHASFLSSKELATLKILNLLGKFQYCPNVSPNNTDTLILNIYGHSLSAQSYGFAIRYLNKIRDNYFGEDIQFKTLEEHQKGLNHHQRDRDLQRSFKKTNDLDIIMGIHAEACRFYLPSNLYIANNSTCISIADIASDLRFNNYYMDFQLDLSTIAFSQSCEIQSPEGQIDPNSNTQLFVDGCTIFENRLFGLPPSEPTYVCNRDYLIGAVTGECTTKFLRRLATGIKAFIFSFDDDENVLPSSSEQTLHDVIFFRSNLESLNLWLRVDNSAFFLSTGKITVDFNNWAGSHYSKKLRILVPLLNAGCIDADSASKHRYRADHLVETDALIQSSVSFTMIEKNSNFERDRQLQQEHIQQHDQRTHRCEFLLHKYLLHNSFIVPVDLPTMKPPSMPFPLRNGDSLPGITSKTPVSASTEFGKVERERSFLTRTNSSTKSTASHKTVQNSSKSTQQDGLNFFSGGFESYISNQENYNSIELSTSTSTSRQTSFYSAIGDINILRYPSSEYFGPQIEPHFPLQGVEPDTTDLPGILIEPKERVSVFESHPDMKIPHVSESEDNVMHSSYMISLNDTIRGFCNPKAVDAIAKLLGAMQAVTPDDLLDELQIESINEIVDKMKIRLLPKTTFDLGLQAPSLNLRFLNSMTPQKMKNQNQDHDQFDVSISRLDITFRSKNDAKKDQFYRDINKSLVLYISIGSAGFVIKEKPKDMEDTQATISCFVDEFLTSMIITDRLTANARLKSFELVTSSRKVRNLASVLQRLKSVTTILSEPLSALPKQQHDRILLFTYLVTTTKQRETEPLFLTRPSYVLRFTTDHIRTQDSWTIISRLHYLYNCLDHSTRLKIASRCAQDPEKTPHDAKQRILTSLAQWSSLDINDIENCILLSKIFNKKSTGSWDSLTHKILLASFQCETFRLVIDPGPKQNTISMSRAEFNFEKKISTLKSKINSPKTDEIVHIMILGASLDDFSIYLNWELYEMLQDILQLKEHNKRFQALPEFDLSENKFQRFFLELYYDLHVILQIRKATLSIDAINVRKISLVDQMEASYIVTRDRRDIISSFIVVGKTASSSIKSYSQELILIQIQSPGVYVSYQTGSEQNISSNGLKIAANCHVLDLFLKQDIIAMIEVMDHVIVDEIAQIYEFIRLSSHASPRNSRLESDLAEISVIPKVSIALFLDRYHISVQLLQSLTHDIFGNVARASIATQLDSEIVFDFDIKDHSHEIKTSTAQGTSTISLLRIPPTNGRITFHIFDKKTVLLILASVEPVVIDAAVLHTLLNTINKPEFLNMIANLQNSIRNIKNNLQYHVYGEKSSQSSKSSHKKPLLFDAHLTFAGFGVFANALSVDRFQKMARLELNLGCVQMVAVNFHNTRGPILKNPELRISLHQIFIKLARGKINSTLESCGSLAVAASLIISSKMNDGGCEIRSYHLNSNSLKINLSSNTASTALDVVGYLQDKIKDIDLSRENNYLRKFRKSQPQIRIHNEQDNHIDSTSRSTKESEYIYSLELMNVQVCWLVENYGSQLPSGVDSEDLVLSLRRMDFSTKKQNSAQLKMQDLQLQMVSSSQNKTFRSLNSALLPEVIFNVGYVSTKNSLRLAFQAGGKLVDLRLTSRFMVPASALRKSFISATEKFREASANWKSISNSQQQQPFFGKRRLESLLVDADFAGAIVHLTSKNLSDSRDRTWGKFNAFKGGQSGQSGNDSSKNSGSNTVLRSPGLACKIEYKDLGVNGFSLNADVKVDASSNIVYPSVVPLLLEMSSTVKYIVSSEEKKMTEAKLNSPECVDTEENKLLNADPSAVLNRTKLNLGLRICGQEFGLSCQPIARVAATAQFEDIYIAVNTVGSDDQGHFFAASATIAKLKTSVQHVYSREATGSFHVENIILSLMNSKHVGSSTGLVAILKISPMKLILNAKQLQDFLLFREIWMPPEIRQKSPASTPPPQTSQPQTILVQRYQQVAATGAFPWNAIVSIAELDVQLDLGQAIGKSAFTISNVWLSSKKNSALEQNLCLGIDKIDVESTGRMSGLVGLLDFKLRTSIKWPANGMAINQTPLVQGSIAFRKFFAKAAFDYHAFLVGDVESLHFLMYNVRNEKNIRDDRLMSILEADVVQVFCTTTCSSQALALYRAFRRLILEKRTNLEASLSEIEKSLNRSSPSQSMSLPKQNLRSLNEIKTADSPISLHTDVLVTLKALNIGVFPTTFLDQQVFKLEALDTEARFAVTMDNGKIHSILGLTLGQLRIGLADVKKLEKPKSLGEVSVDDVINSVTGSRGGTILKVPKVEAIMQTWQVPKSSHIDYIFKSFFEGKVEVGWNYSRISYIRGMWAAHSKALARQLGKPLPLSAVRITGVPDGEHSELKNGEQQKITAEVNVPQSKYDYNAVEPPVIEAPQLRDMGEATPPLEWIGLHRERLPNLTHQIVIVTLLELASQVEDAYARILGYS